MPDCPTITALRLRYIAELAIARGHYRGLEWWQLSCAEGLVFDIALDLDDVPRLLTAWVMYETVAEIADHSTPDATLWHCPFTRR